MSHNRLEMKLQIFHFGSIDRRIWWWAKTNIFLNSGTALICDSFLREKAPKTKKTNHYML